MSGWDRSNVHTAGFGRAECGLFASKSLLAHLLRGAAGAGLLVGAFLYHLAHPALAVGAAVLAVVAMKGCPGCWTLGLFETLANSLRSFRDPARKQRL